MYLRKAWGGGLLNVTLEGSEAVKLSQDIDFVFKLVIFLGRNTPL
jgi:hypothetical protein